MNFLFICSKNKWRSRTAETIFKNVGHHKIQSAGTDSDARIKLNEKHLAWSNLIFVMEKKHKEIIRSGFPFEYDSAKIIVLDIRDEYQYMDEELILILKNAMAPYLGDAHAS
ncbi:low molecular weight protein tyrosine phosphatase family protein [soil metagenome]